MQRAPAFFDDPFGIGPVAVARIRRDIAEAGMAEAAPEAFSTGYVFDQWRAMRRRQFAAARAQYERAQSILNAMGDVQ